MDNLAFFQLYSSKLKKKYYIDFERVDFEELTKHLTVC